MKQLSQLRVDAIVMLSKDPIKCNQPSDSNNKHNFRAQDSPTHGDLRYGTVSLSVSRN